MKIKDAKEIAGSLSAPSKMPCRGYSIPAEACTTGSKIREVMGSVCNSCYALKGRYQFPTVKTALGKRLKALADPRWEDAMVTQIGKQERSGYFRWHDSGDVQSVGHLAKIGRIADRLPDIKFWLPTREYGRVKDYGKRHKNLTVRLSAFMVDGPLPLALAKRTGSVVSGVTANAADATCPAPQQGNQCGDCRACWDSPDPVIYHAH